MIQPLNRSTSPAHKVYPERVLQFGGGNFLRGFADWMIDKYNKHTNAALGVLLVTPVGRDNYKEWQEQEGLYHVLTRGVQKGEVIDEHYLVSSISRILHLYSNWDAFLKSAENPELRFIISNTTEAGIRFSQDDQFTDRPPKEFPAKLAVWLYHRFKYFNGSDESGCIFLPVELILQNGEELKVCILKYASLWHLDQGFVDWIHSSNIFCNTLVDRIVPGIGKDKRLEEMDKLGYEDRMMTQGEPFHFWAIEGPQEVATELPLNQAGLNVLFTNDLSPYRTRKVRILNGAHTSMVPVGYLYGLRSVQEAVEHQVMGAYIRSIIFEEILPTLDLPETELRAYAEDVLERFKNPFIYHELLSISLNSTSKFKTRVLPSILAYKERKGILPRGLVFAFAAFIHFYKGELNGDKIVLKDDALAIEFLSNLWSKCDGTMGAFNIMAKEVLGWKAHWEIDLSTDGQFVGQLAEYLFLIERDGMRQTLGHLLN